MQRRGIKKDFGSGYQRHDGAAGKAEGVKQRQCDHEFVGRAEVDYGADLRDVGEDAAMAVHHALGLAFGAAREQHHGRVIRVCRFDGKLGQPACVTQQPQLVHQPELAS